MIDIPRGDTLITMTRNGEFIVYNACAMKMLFVPREIMMRFLEEINLSKEVKRINIFDKIKEDL